MFAHEPVQEVFTRLQRAAWAIDPHFGTWYFVYFYQPDVAVAETRLDRRDGSRIRQWLDTQELGQLMNQLHEYRSGLTNPADHWRVLLMGGTDDGQISVESIVDDDPTVDEWDFDPEAQVDVVTKAQALLDVQPPPTATRKDLTFELLRHLSRAAVRAAGRKDYGTAYLVARLTGDMTELTSQLRCPGGNRIDDLTSGDATEGFSRAVQAYRAFTDTHGDAPWHVLLAGLTPEGTYHVLTIDDDDPEAAGWELPAADTNTLIDRARQILER